VTHAAVSLAESLGAREIELYGADFSYPLGRTYARGTYIFPYFEARQNRFEPLEALFSRFLYRSPLEKKSPGPDRGAWYYETETLARYRESLKSVGRGARLLFAPGLGAPPAPRPAAPGGPRPEAENPGPAAGAPTAGAPTAGAREFLARYREQIRALPPAAPGSSAGTYLAGLGDEEGRILATLLPLAAALRRKAGEGGGLGIIGETKDYAAGLLDRLLGD
jgi:hypothetical protein